MIRFGQCVIWGLKGAVACNLKRATAFGDKIGDVAKKKAELLITGEADKKTAHPFFS